MRTAIAGVLGVTEEDITLVIESPTTLGVTVRIMDTSTTANGASAPAPSIDAVRDTIESPSFTNTVTTQLANSGVTSVIVAAVVGSVETGAVIVLAPSPPPPTSPPPPPAPLQPAVDLLSSSTSSASTVSAQEGDEAALTAALSMATISLIILILCIPAGLAFMIYYLRRVRGGAQIGNQKVFLNIVSDRAQVDPNATGAAYVDATDQGAGVLALTMGSRTRTEAPTPSLSSTGVRGRLAAPSESGTPMRAVTFSPSSATPPSASQTAAAPSPRSKVALEL